MGLHWSRYFSVLMAVLMMQPSSAIAEFGEECEIQLVYRSQEQNNNQLFQQRYQDNKWNEPNSVYSNLGSLSYGATMASDVAGNLIVVWVERNGSSSQLMYRVKSQSDGWVSRPQEFTSAQGEKSTPLLIRSLSGEIYLSWVSDQNDADDVFLARWSPIDGWSEAEILSVDNAFPDISPNFQYVENIDGTYELLVQWQARSDGGIYQLKQTQIETNLELKPRQKMLAEQCANGLSDVALPASLEDGFLHFPQLGLDSYQRIRVR